MKLNPVSEIIKQEDSKDLLIKNYKTSLYFFRLTPTKAEEEYLSISTDIHSILSSYPDLTNNQKLDYCNSQRYFMKLYLKEVLIKLHKA